MGPLNRAVESRTWDCNRTFVKSNGCSKTFETIPAMLPKVMSLAARMTAGAESFCAGNDVSIFVVDNGPGEQQEDLGRAFTGRGPLVGCRRYCIAVVLRSGTARKQNYALPPEPKSRTRVA